MSPCHPIWYPLALWNGRHTKHKRSCSAHQQTLLVPLQHRMIYHASEMVSLQKGHKTWEQSKTQNFRCHNSQPLLREKGWFRGVSEGKDPEGQIPTQNNVSSSLCSLASIFWVVWNKYFETPRNLAWFQIQVWILNTPPGFQKIVCTNTLATNSLCPFTWFYFQTCHPELSEQIKNSNGHFAFKVKQHPKACTSLPRTSKICPVLAPRFSTPLNFILAGATEALRTTLRISFL